MDFDEDYNAFEVKDTKIINVLLVGRSGTGKTTLLEMIRKKNYEVVSSLGYSDTREPSCYHCMLHHKETKQLYQFNILDTPGLQEHRIDADENRSDDTLLNLALRCIEQNVTRLNAVCFVTKAGDTYEHDIAPFLKLISFLGDRFKPISMIILTHAEQLPDTRIQQYITQIREHKDTKGLAEYCKVGIFASGVINLDHYSEYPEDAKTIVLNIYRKKISEMKNKLLKTLLPLAETPVQNEDLELFVKNVETEKKAAAQKAVDNFKKEQDNKGKSCSIM